METLHRVQIIAVPVACGDGFKVTWREVAGWASDQLQARFGAGCKQSIMIFSTQTAQPYPLAHNYRWSW